MTERDEGESRFFGDYTYTGENRQFELGLLCFYLRGKPDTDEWRSTMLANGHVFIEHNGRIFPTWAVKDVTVLYADDSVELESILRENDLTFDDIPPLDSE